MDTPTKNNGTTASSRQNSGTRHGHRHRRKVVWWLAGVAAVIVLVLSSAAWLPAGKTIRLYIRDGQTAEALCDTLAAQSGSALWTREVMTILRVLPGGRELHNGYYELGRTTTPVAAAIRLRGGRQTPVKVSIVNKRTRAQILDYLASRLQPSATELDSALNALAPRYGLTPENATDIFMDQTFEFWWSASATTVMEKIGANYERFWTPERKAKAEALGLTPPEVMVLASIVQEESNVAAEHGRIGRLYINRLHKGMRLQADPTVRFAMNDFTITRITRPMLAHPSPYNTYRVTGLPPAVICTVRAGVVDRILNSAPTDELYMCAKADFSGQHNFSTDYSTHLRYAHEYQEALDRRNR